MDDVFSFRNDLIEAYSAFSRSFVRIYAPDILAEVNREYENGRYWPEPLIQINPHYKREGTIKKLVDEKMLHPACATIFQTGKAEGKPQPLTLYKHQLEALAKGNQRQSYVVTTGTGSGKSLAFFLPIIDRILRTKEEDSKPRTRAIVIYPMNALANSQLEELEKFLDGYPEDQRPFTVARYTGQEADTARQAIADSPPDVLLTNFMMLELILTRFDEKDKKVVDHCRGLEFLVLDELHTYRGRQGADVAMLVRRLRERMSTDNLVCIGTSATMSNSDSLDERNNAVADVAGKLFGTPLAANDVIGETLERVTDPLKDVASIRLRLREIIEKQDFALRDFQSFQSHPLAIWVELNLGIDLSSTPPRRAKPMTLREAGDRLAQDAGCSPVEAEEALRVFLLAAHDIRTPQGNAPFAFKLHQFISGPGKVYTTLEPQGRRTLTLDAQRFAPTDKNEDMKLYAAHFCRHCGQEYLPVWNRNDKTFEPREIDDAGQDDEDGAFGFLCPDTDLKYHGDLEDLPESWLDFGKKKKTGDDRPKVKSSYKKSVPYQVTVDPRGHGGRGESFFFIPGKFRFCLRCGELYEAKGRDINRLSSLSGEGRSSASTVLTLSALRLLFQEAEPQAEQTDSRKLLGFSDNRQDAALQAGHFNDFISLLTLRAGLIRALELHHGLLDEENLVDAVFRALGFERDDPATLAEYLKTPKLVGPARGEAKRALRFIIGYRLLHDLRRGWRFNNPNLDQLGLLEIGYSDLGAFCENAQAFDGYPVLAALNAAQRIELFSTLFEALRKNLCLQTDYLLADQQDKARRGPSSYLSENWAFAVDEELEIARWLVVGQRPDDHRGKPRSDLVSGGPRSWLLRQIKNMPLWNSTVFAHETKTWKEAIWAELIEAMLEAAKASGFVQSVPITAQLIGWRLVAAKLQWRMPDETGVTKANPFFRSLYLAIARLLRLPEHPLFDFEAQEHTAQIDQERRQILEQRFRYTEKDRKAWANNPAHDKPLERLPVLFCSPTMELGVDISSLNTVYLRNVPPTPANYAQRSGRGGRSGQQALVVTYCAAQSPHDQWFFKHASQMVHGVVRPPTLDLANRDLIDSHIHAVWLACAEIDLPEIRQLLDLEQPEKPLKPEYRERIHDSATLARAQASARRVVTLLDGELDDSGWFSNDYVEEIVARAPHSFSDSLNRWRKLYDATSAQIEIAHQIIQNHVSSQREKEDARRRYIDALQQRNVLERGGNHSDFYIYRYLASQGFLPGYNFPRLPLMAWIPASGRANTGGKADDGNMVSRPRFLALSEFGPRSLIYHQGRMYRVQRAKLNASSADHISGVRRLGTLSSLVCGECGYGHMGGDDGADPLANCCEYCGAALTEHDWVRELYRIETVETVPVKRITIDDEDRQRQGFELQTTWRFLPGRDGVIQRRPAVVKEGDAILAELVYAPAARLWRINRGWRRRKEKSLLGFYINPITGYWSKQNTPEEEDGDDETVAQSDKASSQRIVPFVEDHRNILILTPSQPLDTEAMTTLQSALKRGIEMEFQIEESELVAEPLPRADTRKALLFYEAAEGGAGVLTRLVSEPAHLASVAGRALELMHYVVPKARPFQPDRLSEEDGNRCRAGCYQCLLSYYNQPDHEHIDRRNKDVVKLLTALANAQVEPLQPEECEAPPETNIGDTVDRWLDALSAAGLRQPDAMRVSIGKGQAEAAARYNAARALVFVVPIPDAIRTGLIDKGWRALDFSDETRWSVLFMAHADVFAASDGETA